MRRAESDRAGSTATGDRTPPGPEGVGRVSLIVAASDNNVIGVNGGLPWHLPDDLKRFKRITLGKSIVMGRLTHESIGRPLPGRRNIVISARTGYAASGCEVAGSPHAALELCVGEDEVMIIGGGAIYAAFLPLAERIYLTRVHTELSGDAFFPVLDEARWTATEREAMAARDGLAATFQLLERM